MTWILGYFLIGLVVLMGILILRDEDVETKDALEELAKQSGLNRVVYYAAVSFYIVVLWPWFIVEFVTRW